MKKLLLVIAGLLLVSTIAKGAYQNITNDLVVGNRVAASSSAVLQVESTTKGFLPPRMNSTQRDAIASPVEGLTIFNTTLNAIQVYAGGAWGNVGGGGSDHPIWTASTVYGIGTIVVDSSDSNWKVYRANTAHTSTSSVFGDDIALGYWDELANNIDNISSSVSSSVAVWDGVTGDKLGQTPVLIDDLGNVTGANDLTMSGNADITGNVVASGSVTATGLEIYSTSVGSIPCPKMTEAERDAIGTPVQGYCVFNTTTNKLNIYDGTDWVSAGGGLSKWLPATNYKQYDVVWNDGDNKIYFANSDFTSGGTFTPSNWTELSNDVNASGSVVDNRVVRWDGTTGDSIQNSLVTIDDSGNIDTPASITTQGLTATGSVAFSSFDANSVLYTDTGGAITQNNPGFTYNGNTLILSGAGVAGLVDLTQSGSGTSLNINNSGTGDFIVVDTSDFVVKNSGRVGIGTDSPSVPLQVVGASLLDQVSVTGNSVQANTLNDDINLVANGTGDVNLVGNSVYIDGNINVNNAVISGTSDINPITLVGSGERVVVNDPIEFTNTNASTAAASGKTKLYVNASGSVAKLSEDGLSIAIDKNRSLDIYYQENMDYTPLADWGTGNNIDFLTAGTFNGTLTRETSYAKFNGAVIKYVAGASSTNDWISSPAIPIKKEAGGFTGISMHYEYDGDAEVNLVMECTAGATWVASSSIASSSAVRLADSQYIPDGCTEIKYGFHFINAPTNGDILVFDDVELSTNPVVYKNLTQTQYLEYSEAQSALNSNTTELRFSGSLTSGSFTGNGCLSIEDDSVNTRTKFISSCKTSVFIAVNGQNTNAGAQLHIYKNGSLVIPGNQAYTGTANQLAVGNLKLDAGDYFSIYTSDAMTGAGTIYLTIVSAAESEHVITPAKSNMSDWEEYTPTFTGFGTPSNVSFFWRRIGSDLILMGKFSSGNPTAVEAQISLPTGLTVLSGITKRSVGDIIKNVDNSADYHVLVTEGDSFINVGVMGGGSAGLNEVTGSAQFSNAEVVSVFAIIPIEGWTSNAQFLAAIPVQQTCYVKDVKSSGTSGGTSSTSYATRTLNTTSGSCSFLSLSSNRFTLDAGTYHISAEAPQYRGAGGMGGKIKLVRNPSGTPSDEIIGQVARNGTDASTIANLSGQIVVTSAIDFEIQHQTNAAATDGFGVALSYGDSEVYTVVKITKVK